MSKLDGKVAIVTGGGRGIGRAIAEGFAKEGARVVVTAAKERQEIDSFASSHARDQALALLADVTDPPACERVVAETITRFGRLDVVVNNSDFMDRFRSFRDDVRKLICYSLTMPSNGKCTTH